MAELTLGWCWTVGHLQTMLSDPWQTWHFSHPFPTFFSSRHSKSIPDRHWGDNMKTSLWIFWHHSTKAHPAGSGWVRLLSHELEGCGGSFTCDTIRCGPLLHISLSSGYRRDSSWPGRIHSASVHPHSAHARSCQSLPLWVKNGKGKKKINK